jgi:hypothetical protein
MPFLLNQRNFTKFHYLNKEAKNLFQAHFFRRKPFGIFSQNTWQLNNFNLSTDFHKQFTELG